MKLSDVTAKHYYIVCANVAEREQITALLEAEGREDAFKDKGDNLPHELMVSVMTYSYVAMDGASTGVNPEKKRYAAKDFLTTAPTVAQQKMF